MDPNKVANDTYVKIVICINHVVQAMKEDADYQRDVTKKTDGTESWIEAADYFSDLVGWDIDYQTLCLIVHNTKLKIA